MRTKLSFFKIISIITLLLAYNNCAPSFNANNNVGLNSKKLIPGTPPDKKNILTGKLTCARSINTGQLLSGNIKLLTKQQYENSIYTIFNFKINTTFNNEHEEKKFRTSFDYKSLEIDFIEKIFDNAKLVIDDISDNDSIRNKVFFCDFNNNNCFDQFINKWGRLIYRRSLTTDEVGLVKQRATALSQKTQNATTSWGKFKASLFILLTSHQFIYQSYGLYNTNNAITKMNDVELATKLSFFIWGSGPDEILINLAETNQLRPKLNEQVSRLLNDPRSIYVARELSQNWLNLGLLNSSPKDYDEINNYSNYEIKNAVTEQLDLFLMSLIKSDSPVTDLISSNKMFHNNITKELYKIENLNSNSNEFTEVENSLNQDNGIGIFGHIGLLSSVASALDYSIFHRGPWVLNNILCQEVPPPPEGVSLDGNNGEFESLTVALSQHGKSGSDCYRCHKIMDPLGAALERYDSLGQYRENYSIGDSPINYSYDTTDGYTISSASDLSDYILTNRKSDFEQCFTTQLLTLASAKNHTSRAGQCSSQNLYANIPGKNLSFSQLIYAIIESDNFQMISKGDSL